MTDDKSYRFALLDRIEAELEQHGRAIADLQVRLAQYDLRYGQAVVAMDERFDAQDEWIKDVVTLLKELRDMVNKP
jgi:hypothetical protein